MILLIANTEVRLQFLNSYYNWSCQLLRRVWKRESHGTSRKVGHITRSDKADREELDMSRVQKRET
jgi:hypothetical protein